MTRTQLPRLHLLGLPHTITSDAFSHCAYTGKVKKFAPMMRPLGYEVIHYGNHGAESGADRQVNVLSRKRFRELLGHDLSDPKRTHGEDAHTASPLYREYNRALAVLLRRAVRQHDLVLHTFGHATQPVAGSHPGINVESGIGYPTTWAPWRIYESEIWRHRDHQRHQREGGHYEWTIPNYFVAEDWPLGSGAGDYLLYFGRLTSLKGLETVIELAGRLPKRRVIICGQGDPAPWLKHPNIEYLPPVTGSPRAKLLGDASLVLMPSNFDEPFGGVAVEAMLCGTPVATVDYGAFVETVEHGVCGWRCKVLEDWLAAVRYAGLLDRAAIRKRAVARFGLEAVGRLYDRAFRMIHGVHTGADWFSFPTAIERPRAPRRKK